MSLRLRAVSYLNSRPLTISLENNPAFELSYSVPSVCAADLEAGRADLGLIPSIEYARSRESYCIVPDVAIVSRGEVLTVRLFWRGDLRRVKRIALDTSSRTAAALLHILLREKFRLAPEFAEAGPALETMLETADAALLIGDPVFQFIGTDLNSMDLGQVWTEFSGMPFVFAFWAGRRGVVNPGQVLALKEARLAGEEQAAAIACKYSRDSARSAEFYERYLTGNISFDFGEAEIEGLYAFYRLAQRHGLIEAVPALRFYESDEVRA